MMVYICTKFHENSLNTIKVIYIGKISKGHYSIKKCRWSYDSFFSAHRPMMVCISTKFHENILDGIKVIERTRIS